MTIIQDGSALLRKAFAVTAFAFLPGCSVILPEAEAATPETAQTTRFWDCCKPSGSWSGRASLKTHPVNTCAKDGKTVLSNYDTKSGCDGGTSFMCGNQQPWAVNADLAYGFASVNLAGKSESETSCACYELKFTNGPVVNKTFVVQAISRGADRGGNSFELMIPGGGVGIFNGCQAQYNAPANGWGNRYGGVTSQADCATLPTALQPGCRWRFGWFQNADNPSATFSRIKCPAAITDKTGCIRQDD